MQRTAWGKLTLSGTVSQQRDCRSRIIVRMWQLSQKHCSSKVRFRVDWRDSQD
jgi:hypothetical protein